MGRATGVGRSIGLKNPQNHTSLGEGQYAAIHEIPVYAVAAAAAVGAMVAIPAIAQDKQPIKIGFGMRKPARWVRTASLGCRDGNLG